MHSIHPFVYWAPRIGSIIFICFLALFSLDVFSMGLTAWQTIGAFLIHNIPAYVLLIILWIAWKHEIVGGIFFLGAGMLYIASLIFNVITSGFEWYYLSWSLTIAGPAFFIGILFFMNWLKRRRIMRSPIS